jgi:hypothetical protein
MNVPKRSNAAAALNRRHRQCGLPAGTDGTVPALPLWVVREIQNFPWRQCREKTHSSPDGVRWETRDRICERNGTGCERIMAYRTTA